jgi:hypothetical protein
MQQGFSALYQALIRHEAIIAGRELGIKQKEQAHKTAILAQQISVLQDLAPRVFLMIENIIPLINWEELVATDAEITSKIQQDLPHATNDRLKTELEDIQSEVLSMAEQSESEKGLIELTPEAIKAKLQHYTQITTASLQIVQERMLILQGLSPDLDPSLPFHPQFPDRLQQRAQALDRNLVLLLRQAMVRTHFLDLLGINPIDKRLGKRLRSFYQVFRPILRRLEALTDDPAQFIQEERQSIEAARPKIDASRLTIEQLVVALRHIRQELRRIDLNFPPDGPGHIVGLDSWQKCLIALELPNQDLDLVLREIQRIMEAKAPHMPCDHPLFRLSCKHFDTLIPQSHSSKRGQEREQELARQLLGIAPRLQNSSNRQLSEAITSLVGNLAALIEELEKPGIIESLGGVGGPVPVPDSEPAPQTNPPAPKPAPAPPPQVRPPNWTPKAVSIREEQDAEMTFKYSQHNFTFPPRDLVLLIVTELEPHIRQITQQLHNKPPTTLDELLEVYVPLRGLVREFKEIMGTLRDRISFRYQHDFVLRHGEPTGNSECMNLSIRNYQIWGASIQRAQASLEDLDEWEERCELWCLGTYPVPPQGLPKLIQGATWPILIDMASLPPTIIGTPNWKGELGAYGVYSIVRAGAVTNYVNKLEEQFEKNPNELAPISLDHLYSLDEQRIQAWLNSSPSVTEIAQELKSSRFYQAPLIDIPVDERAPALAKITDWESMVKQSRTPVLLISKLLELEARNSPPARVGRYRRAHMESVEFLGKVEAWLADMFLRRAGAASSLSMTALQEVAQGLDATYITTKALQSIFESRLIAGASTSSLPGPFSRQRPPRPTVPTRFPHKAWILKRMENSYPGCGIGPWFQPTLDRCVEQAQSAPPYIRDLYLFIGGPRWSLSFKPFMSQLAGILRHPDKLSQSPPRWHHFVDLVEWSFDNWMLGLANLFRKTQALTKQVEDMEALGDHQKEGASLQAYLTAKQEMDIHEYHYASILHMIGTREPDTPDFLIVFKQEVQEITAERIAVWICGMLGEPVRMYTERQAKFNDLWALLENTSIEDPDGDIILKDFSI